MSLDRLIDELSHETPVRPVSPLLGFGIFVLPIFFVWFLLRDGHSKRSKIFGFLWLFLWLYVPFV